MAVRLNISIQPACGSTAWRMADSRGLIGLVVGGLTIWLLDCFCYFDGEFEKFFKKWPSVLPAGFIGDWAD